MDDNRPIDRIHELEQHIQELIETPETQIDAKLFDDIELQLTPSNIQPLIPQLLPSLTTILNTTPHDPTAIASLATKLLTPLKLTDILQLASEEALTLALESPAPSVNLLALFIISKARSPSDVAILSIMAPLIQQLVVTWLSAPSVEVGQKATEVFGELLEIDSAKRKPGMLNAEMNGGKLQLRAEPKGQGLLWRRIFGEKEIYGSIFELCGDGSDLDEKQKSLAQGRLLRLLARIAVLDMDAFRSPAAMRNAENGLLWWASTAMVDKADVLMHITLLDFVVEFLKVVSEQQANISPAQLKSLGELVSEVVKDDEMIAENLQAIATNEDTSPELLGLLSSLKIGQSEGVDL